MKNCLRNKSIGELTCLKHFSAGENHSESFLKKLLPNVPHGSVLGAWCKSGTTTTGPGTSGHWDPGLGPPQSLKVGPGTLLKFKSRTPGTPSKFKSGTLGTLQN